TRAQRVAAGVADDDPSGIDPFEVCVSATVLLDSRVWGFLLVGSDDPRRVAVDAEERLERFAAITALAISSSESRARLAALASTDPLTGLPNRRAFHDRLEADLARVRRTDEPLSLVVIDVDHFKRVNDNFGHETGDHVLVEFARRLRATARVGETVARVGGEEFAWIIPGCDGMDALRAVERARAEIARRPFPVAGRITASAGVCDLDDAEDASELYRRADMALYWAKSSGRNRSFRFSQDAVGILGMEAAVAATAATAQGQESAGSA
ncbi:MAG: GGDEF domain-containing protein, partial [Miltoncostaeaceae bacterium]